MYFQIVEFFQIVNFTNNLRLRLHVFLLLTFRNNRGKFFIYFFGPDAHIPIYCLPKTENSALCLWNPFLTFLLTSAKMWWRHQNCDDAGVEITAGHHCGGETFHSIFSLLGWKYSEKASPPQWWPAVISTPVTSSKFCLYEIVPIFPRSVLSYFITWIALLNGQYGKWVNLIGLESSYYKAILPVKKRQLIFKVNKAQCSVFLCKENTVKFSLLIQKINHCLSFPKIWIPWPCNKRDTDCFVHLYEKYKAFGSA